jgi:hypothetical protein
MNKEKRPSVLEVAKILRKYNNHRLNRKVYRDFNDNDFKSVRFIVENGYADPKDLSSFEKTKTYVLQDKKGNPIEFESVSEMAEFFGFRAKNYWKKYIKEAGYEFVKLIEE